MIKLKIISEKYGKLVLFALETMKKMRVLIPKSAKGLDILKNTKEDPLTKCRYIDLEESWGQGLFHNISSFVHQLEQLFRKKLLTRYINNELTLNLNERSWQQLVHSDDKNEMISLYLNLHPLFVKFSTYVPRLFSLSTSETKDSFSRIASEMVGVLNIRSFIFDNPIKSSALTFEPFEDVSYSQNYKYILGRSVNYYEKSEDLLGALAIENLGYHYLKKVYKLNDYSAILPLNTY